MPMSTTEMRGRHRAAPATGVVSTVLVPALLVLVGIAIILYPVASTLWNNYQTTKVARAYAEIEQTLPQEVKNQQWDSAKAYNESQLPGPILDPWIDYIAGKSPEYDAYLKELNANQSMARLVIPSIEVDLPVYHGTDHDTLQKGLGHLYGSDLPVGGPGTHSIITGHTGLPNATMFDNLKKVKEGDVFFIAVAGQSLKYEVDRISVVLPHEVSELDTDDEGDYVTLITCTPYGINTHRLLVRAHAVPISPAEAEALKSATATVWVWWMYVLLAAAAIIFIGLVYWVIRKLRDNARAGANTLDAHDDTRSS